jgi:hypothetical protein
VTKPGAIVKKPMEIPDSSDEKDEENINVAQ